ncbi:Bis(5'-nucleosyl)-tetraphosphatase [asymmetrical], partial [Pseudolycoriella hygida]
FKLFSRTNYILGHVDAGEDDFTTALRETSEEAGYTENDLVIHKDKAKVLNYEVSYKGKKQDKIVTYWLAELKNEEQDPTLSDEHTEFRWLPKAAAVQLSGYKDFEQMVEHFDSQIKAL